MPNQILFMQTDSVDTVLTVMNVFLKDFKPKHFRMAIEDDVSIKKVLEKLQPMAIFGLVAYIRLTGRFKREIETEFNYDNVMVYMKDSRPDLYDEICNTKIGQLWFRKNIEEIKQSLVNGG